MDFDAGALLAAAREVRRNAHAPYSGFAVGAALLDTAGAVHPGVNVENASFGLGTCAERSAVVRAIGEGVRGFRAIAVAGPGENEPCMPCGSCRQILHEIAPGLSVVVAGSDGSPQVLPLTDLLPHAFGSAACVRRSDEVG